MHSVMSDIAVYKGSGDRVFARFDKVFQVGKTAVGLKQGCGRWGILKTSKWSEAWIWLVTVSEDMHQATRTGAGFG